MRIFEFDDYKKFVSARIQDMPNRGRGQFQKIAIHLRIHSTLVSQIFSGSRDLTGEQACELCEYLELNEHETDYFLNLVETERAGSLKLKQALKRQREQILGKAKALTSRFPKAKSLSEGEQAIFFSQWYYTAILLLADTPTHNTVEEISRHLSLGLVTVRNGADFLIRSGLLEEKEGILKPIQNWILAPKNSAQESRHHINWRLRALEQIPTPRENEIFFTGPIVLSEKDRLKVKKMLEDLIAEVSKVTVPSPSETLACLNIDFFAPAKTLQNSEVS